MNTIIFSSGLGMGGAEEALVKIMKGADLINSEITIVSLSSKNDRKRELVELGCRVIEFPLKDHPIRNLGKLAKFLLISRRANPKYIVGWMYLGNLLATLYFLIAFRRCVLTWSIRQSLSFWKNETIWLKTIIHLNRLLSKLPNTIIYNSLFSMKQHNKFGFYGDNAVFIPNGFQLPSPSKVAINREKFRDQQGYAEKDVVFGLVGRFHPVKGHELLCQVWKHEFEHTPNVKLVVIGEGVQSGWKALGNVSENITLIDKVENAKTLMCGFDCLVLCSQAEAFPNVVGEAMSVSLPVIATDVGDVKSILPNIQTVIESEDANALKSQMKSFLKLSASQRHSVGSENRQIIQEGYNIKKVGKSHFPFFGLSNPSK